MECGVGICSAVFWLGQFVKAACQRRCKVEVLADGFRSLQQASLGRHVTYPSGGSGCHDCEITLVKSVGRAQRLPRHETAERLEVRVVR